MARKNIELGVIPTGQGGDTFRSAMIKVNDMTAELYTAIEEGAGKVQTVAGVDPDAAGDIPKAALATAVGVDEKADKTALENKVDKVAGKVLSSNDFTTPEKNKLAAVIDARDYGIGAVAPETQSIYQIKKGGITFWNQETAGRPPAAGAGQLLSMTGGANGEFSSFIATSFAEDKVWLSRISGTDRSAWKRFLLAGDQGIGGRGASVPENDCNKALVSGNYAASPTTLNGMNVYGTLEVIDYDGGNSVIQRLTTTRGHPIGEVTWFRSVSGNAWTSWNRLLNFGEFGISGQLSRAPAGTNPNNLSANTQRIWLGSDSTGGPAPGDWIIEHVYLQQGYVTQRAQRLGVDFPGVYTRVQLAGSWGEWTNTSIESVTNANGTAIKFPDGTMICYAQGGAEKTTSNPNGNIWAGNDDTFTYPVPFKSLAGVIPTVAYSLNAYVWCCVGAGQDLVKCTINGFSGGSNGKYVIRYMAIGRWK